MPIRKTDEELGAAFAPGVTDSVIQATQGQSNIDAARAAGFSSTADARAAGFQFASGQDAPGVGVANPVSAAVSGASPVGAQVDQAGTAGQLYGDLMTPEERALSEERSRQALLAKSAAFGEVDPNKVRQDTIKRFQDEIDALNEIYRQKRLEAEIQGQGRIGTGTAIQARRGLIGSDFGTAQKQNIQAYNQRIQDAIAAEKAQAMANIYSKARGEAEKEIQDKVKAQKEGAESYIKFLSGEAERKATRVKKVAYQMLTDDIDESLMEDADWKGIADELGVSADVLKQSYQAQIQEQAAAEAESWEKPMKVGNNLVDPRTGKVIYEGKEEEVLPDTQIVKAGGRQLLINTQTGETIKDLGGAYKTTGTSSGTSTGFNVKNAEKAMTSQMSQIVGSDGFVSPDNYLKARNAWIAEGGNPTTFDTKFRGFKNPENPYYIN